MKSIRKGLYIASTVAMATAAAATYYVLVKQPNDKKAAKINNYRVLNMLGQENSRELEGEDKRQAAYARLNAFPMSPADRDRARREIAQGNAADQFIY